MQVILARVVAVALATETASGGFDEHYQRAIMRGLAVRLKAMADGALDFGEEAATKARRNRSAVREG